MLERGAPDGERVGVVRGEDAAGERFDADDAGEAGRGERGEERGEVDEPRREGAAVVLVELEVREPRERSGERAGEVALLDVHVERIEVQPDVVRSDRGEEFD